MKVLLIREATNDYSPSLGLASLASQIEGICTVKIVDNNGAYGDYSHADLFSIIDAFNPDIIGFSLFITNCIGTYNLIKKIRESNYCHTLLVAGGPHATILPDEAMRHGIDIVVSGEGEQTFLELIQSAIDKKDKINRTNYFPVMSDIHGIVYGMSDGEYITTPVRPPIMNLDVL